MSGFVQREATFALFKNTKKTKDTAPDMTGTVTINGVQHELAAWWTTPKSNGEQYLNGKVGGWKKPENKAGDQQQQTTGGKKNF